jgi:lysozyme
MATKPSSRATKATTKRPAPELKSNDEIANEVLAGRWGTGDDRKERLEEAGYNYVDVQRVVNQRVGKGAPAAYRSSITEIAQQVIAGHYGDDEKECRRLLEGAGWNFAAVVAEVKRLDG